MKLRERVARGIVQRYADGKIRRREAEMRLSIISTQKTAIKTLLDAADEALDTDDGRE